MALIQQLGQSLDNVAVEVRSVQLAMNGCSNDSSIPMKSVDTQRQDLPGLATTAKSKLTDLAANLTTTKQQLHQLQLDLAAQAGQLATDGGNQIATLKGDGQRVRDQLTTLTDAVSAHTKDLATRSQTLSGALSDLVGAAGTSGTEATDLIQSHNPARDQLVKSEEITRQTYDTEKFVELQERLNALRAKIDKDTQETLPQEAGKLDTALRGEHGEANDLAIDSYFNGSQSARDDYQKITGQLASALREAELGKMNELVKLANETLTEDARSNMQKALDQHKALAEVVQKLFKDSDEILGYLTKEHAPFYPAVKELHIALKGMVGR